MAEEKKIVKKPVAKKPVAKKPAAKVAKVAAAKPAEKVAKVAAVKPAAKKQAGKKTVSVTLVKSFFGRLPKHRATITGLGLKRINHTVELADTPEIRGMINKVAYLLKVEG
ncbi:MAG: 50S ribosomal protein L30 [Candidatus Thioglobus sp.]|nr:MAG: 50S ribosomal protein L30 [Candidatus Thioglobus sp.]